MTFLSAVLGAALLFAVFGYAATRKGTRLEGGGRCHGDSCSLDEGCGGCSEETHASGGWWPATK
jgi:hypothetical protein